MFHLGSDPRLLRSRLYLLGLILAFVGPLVASTLVYLHPDLRSQVTVRSYGTLILPPRPLARDLFRAADQSTRWSLLYRAQASSCTLECEASLFMMRQVHRSLGNKQTRVQTLILFENPEHQDAYRKVLQRAPSIRALRPNALKWSQFDGLPADALFIVDPLGNLLMHYGPDSTSRDLLKDLKRLLTASRIG